MGALRPPLAPPRASGYLPCPPPATRARGTARRTRTHPHLREPAANAHAANPNISMRANSTYSLLYATHQALNSASRGTRSPSWAAGVSSQGMSLRRSGDAGSPAV